ncbi:hypothetical protein R4Z10_08275 [Niallia sp. XMNu-256]|uniref:hypothetical protein n=1 Tax=Niallia sp. XMNu-256 TaxID=3082444 RepID=UPI0030CAD5D4
MSSLYIIPLLTLLIGLELYFVGGSRKENKLKGVGIGFIACLIPLESPNFIQGFVEGFANGYID